MKRIFKFNFIKNYANKCSFTNVSALSMCALAVLLNMNVQSFADNVPVPKTAGTENSYYQLEETSTQTESTITKYEWNEQTKTLEPTHYEVKLTDINIGTGSDKVYYNWDTYAGRPYLDYSETPTGGDYITINYDFDSLPVEELYNPESNTLDSVNGVFVGLDTAVGNSGLINKIDGVFASNGTAISNYGKIASVAGYFIANENSAIRNSGEISLIDGYFASNVARRGGAIYNASDDERTGLELSEYKYRTVDLIKGTYIANQAESYGGAIYNEGFIDKIDADFIGNRAEQGGAIYNREGEINSINGTFIGNTSSSAGGAIASLAGYIDEVSGDFYRNKSIGSYSAQGGAISNLVYTAGRAIPYVGGYIEPYGVKKINGNFVENAAIAQESRNVNAMGGAIYNIANIDEINGNFYKNTAVVRYALNPHRITDKSVSNFSSDDWLDHSVAAGGAIANDSMGWLEDAHIGKITGNFIENYAVVDGLGYGTALGGAVYNNSVYNSNVLKVDNGMSIFSFMIDSKFSVIQDSNFVNNSALATTLSDKGDYISPVNAFGGAIASIVNYNISLVPEVAKIDELRKELQDKGVDVNGLSDKQLIDKYVVLANEEAAAEGFPFLLTTDINPKISNSYFEGNKAVAEGNERSMALGGAIYSVMKETQHEPEEFQNSVSKESSDNIFYDKSNYSSLEITNTSFVNNLASSPNGTAKGGAIYSEGNLTINADNGVSLFKGNKTIDKNGEESNAIYMASLIDFRSDEARMSSLPENYNYMIKTAQLNLNAKNNGVIQIDDKIAGGAVNVNYDPRGQAQSINLDDAGLTEEDLWDTPFIETPETAFDLNINGDNTGKVILNNDVINANITLDNTNLYLGRENVFDQSQSLTLNSGSMFLINNSIGEMHIPTLNINGNTNLAVDVDLANKSMDRLTADNYNIASDSNLNVNYLNLLSDAAEDKTLILFADEQLKNNVAYTGESPIAYSPIWKYDVSYLKDSGEFMFVRGAAGSSESYNPAVLPAPVVTQAGAYSTQMQTFNYAFQHADNFMMFPSLERVAFASQNKYALAPDNGVFSPLMTPSTSNSFWVKPYASFESVPLQNGPKVSNINYGTLIGHDSEMKDIGNGFARVLTGYIGYNGSSQRFQGVDSYQNGGVLGGTATFYKGNFFNATTLSVGASAGDASTMYGNENFAMLMAGVGNKTGYNFEFKGGRFIFQPAMLMSYSFINTFDYTNAAGIRIDSDPLHAIQLSPGLKFIMNTESGWQPYLAVDMVWNILDDTRVRANDVRLPSMSIKPYVSYGLGVQRRFKNDKYTAFGQTMIHNGGRRGVSLTFGLRWKVGK